jgi:methylated-DNA-protein-cysteine methyltransferase-like protein
MPLATPFSMQPTHNDPRIQRILATVDCIPPGRVATYGQVASEAGLAGRARLVGRILAELPKGSHLPWHRVLQTGGGISPRPGPGPTEQRARLAKEGVAFTLSGRVDLKSSAWNPDETP